MSEEINPWTIRSSKTIYDNPWIRVTEFDVLNPSGRPGIYGKVHFKNLAIGVIPIDEYGDTWLVGQYRFPLQEYSWEIPEGGGPLDREPLESAKRELLEETGLTAQIWIPLLTMHLSNSVSDELAIVYLAKDLGLKTAAPGETEKLQVKKLPFDELVQMVKKGLITDAITVAAVLKLKIMMLDGEIRV